MKPSSSDYLPFLEAARGHDANALVTGSLVDAELARLMYAEATRLRLEALYPPERCIECGATIHSDEMKCGTCGRARQGVKLGTRHVLNLLRFFESYNLDSAEQRRQARSSRERAARAKVAAERRAEGLCARSKPNSMRSWALRLGMANSTLLRYAREKGSLQAAVEHFRPGGWPAE